MGRYILTDADELERLKALEIVVVAYLAEIESGGDTTAAQQGATLTAIRDLVKPREGRRAEPSPAEHPDAPGG